MPNLENDADLIRSMQIKLANLNASARKAVSRGAKKATAVRRKAAQA